MNFDYLRLLAASTVMLTHYGYHTEKYWNFFNTHNAVCAFFCISGFLITQSYLRSTSLEEFFKKRIARIYPPIFITFTTIIIFGIYFKKEPSYLISASQILLFQDWSPMQSNSIYSHGAFWTLVVEFQFYLILPLIIFCIQNNTKLTTISLVTIYVIICLVLIKYPHALTAEQHSVVRQSVIMFFPFFFSAICLSFLWKNLDLRKKVALTILALLLFQIQLTVTFAIGLSILVISSANLLGHFFGKKIPIGDMSYGIYIYHFPVREIMLTNGTYSNISAIIVVLILSFASWHLMEKRTIKFVSKKLTPKTAP